MEERGGQSPEDKTEEASDERRKQYREEGNIANPREIVGAFALLICALALAFLGRTLFESMRLSFNRSWTLVTRHDLGLEGLLGAAGAIAEPFLGTLAALAVGLTALPVLLGLLFTRFNWTLKKLEFKLEKLNPFTGLQRIVSGQGATELVKSVVKFAVLSAVCWSVLKAQVTSSELAHFKAPEIVLGEMGSDVVRLIVSVSLASFGIGALDFGWSWWQLERQMKMTKQEVKDEAKAQEGDPHVKGQRRRLARDIVTRKTLAKVSEATFVVTNPTHFSIAVRWVKGMAAPTVVAKGQDYLALRIREIAKERDIIMVENKALARTLYKTVKVGQEVPPSLYAAVIEVMRYIHALRGKNYFDRSQFIDVRPGASGAPRSRPDPTKA